MCRDGVDGGWGWIVVIGAFIHHVITHGVFLSIGIIFLSLQEALGGSKAQIAWIVSIEIGSGFLSGPLTGYLISKYGTRIVSVIGSILGASGYILSAWAENIYILYATMGLISGCNNPNLTMFFESGVGIGMIIIDAIVVVNGYFDKHRGFAVGISMAGTGVGAFLFNPLLDWMVKTYGWRGSLLLLSAIILNCIPAGLVYRPLPHLKHKRSKIREAPEIDNPTTVNSNETDVHTPIFRSRDGCLELIYEAPANQPKQNDRFLLDSDKSKNVNNNGTDVYTPIFKSYDGCIELIYEEPVDHTKQKIPFQQDSENSKTINGYGLDVFTPIFESSDECVKFVYEAPGVQSRQNDTCLQASEILKQRHIDNVEIKMLESVEQIKRPKIGFKGQLSLFKNVVFTMTVLAQFLFNFGFYVPYVYIPDKSKLEGIEETSTVWVLSTMGLSSIFGRILFGNIADRPSVNRLLLYTSGFLISGSVTALVPWYNELWMMYCYAILYGMFTGMVLGLTPVILIDLLGLEILPATFGISCLFRGLASLLGSPCAGFLVDLTGTFTAAFTVSGLSMLSGSLVMMTARYVKGKHAKK